MLFHPGHKKEVKVATVIFLCKDQQVLLAMKKRGFGVGKWNGPGGKVQEGETPEQAAIRETQEEIGATPKRLDFKGILTFCFQNEIGEDDWVQEVHVFVTDKWSGDIIESEEMRPQWFTLTDIPYDEMWVDDKYWLPRLLEGKKVEGNFLFNPDMKLVDYSLSFKK